jgi:hypothetical protein
MLGIFFGLNPVIGAQQSSTLSSPQVQPLRQVPEELV